MTDVKYRIIEEYNKPNTINRITLAVKKKVKEMFTENL